MVLTKEVNIMKLISNTILRDSEQVTYILLKNGKENQLG